MRGLAAIVVAGRVAGGFLMCRYFVQVLLEVQEKRRSVGGQRDGVVVEE